MKRPLVMIAMCLTMAFAVEYSLEAQARSKKASRKPAMKWADSLILGMEEARLRNIPIVVHLLSDT